uniref:Methyltransferase domain-containing protein n=1 Tax=Staphylothermus marinus TaxID=2280 RepID=A0A7J3KFW0_STAMA
MRKHLVRNKNIEKFLYRIYRESFNEGIRPISRLEGSILMTLTTLICLKGTATLLDAGAGLGFSTAWLILGSALLPNINVTIDVVEYNKNRFEKLVSNIRELLNTTQLKRVRINYIFEDVIEYLKKINYQYDLAFIDIEKHQ